MKAQREARSDDVRVFIVPIVSRVPRVSQGDGRRTVVDNPGMAWAYSDQSPYTALPAGLVEDYRFLLDLAATELIGPVLAACWEARGFTVAFGTRSETENYPLPDAVYHHVWDAAASLLDPDLIVRHAGLDDIRHTYS